MQVLGIKARIRQRKYNYIKTKPYQVAENILNRDFKASKPNEKWVTDVTEFSIPGEQGKLYLSAILDLYDNSIIAHKLGTSNSNILVFQTFDLAMKRNKTATPLFHSDRGFQYTSRYFKNKLENLGIEQSMSRVGKCIDNGPMESFWGTLKSESYYGLTYKSRADLINGIEKYIHFYNHERFQPVLKNMTPFEVRGHVISIL